MKLQYLATTFSNFRPKSPRAPHAFGGLSFGIKTELRAGVRYLPTVSPDLMWNKLCKNFFNLQKDVYVGLVYISPAGSAYSARNIDLFDQLERDIAKHSEHGSCFICGDFNARSLTENDVAIFDSMVIPEVTSNSSVYWRNR